VQGCRREAPLWLPTHPRSVAPIGPADYAERVNAKDGKCTSQWPFGSLDPSAMHVYEALTSLSANPTRVGYVVI
jgi:hypothetical protein